MKNGRPSGIVETLWQAYVEACELKTAPAIQLQETRRAFYAGVAGMLSVAGDVADMDLPDEAGAALLETIHQELVRFGESVVAGKA